MAGGGRSDRRALPGADYLVRRNQRLARTAMHSRAQSLTDCRSYNLAMITPLLLSALATLPAIAFLIVVHRTVLARFLAARSLRRKRCRANHHREDRHQDFRVILHGFSLGPDTRRLLGKVENAWPAPKKNI